MAKNNIGFLTFEQLHNKHDIGSTRIRVKWLLNYWPEAEEYKMGRKYDTIIFQKVYFTELAELFKGVKILDLCDPDWFDHQPVKKMIELCDAVTVSSPKLKEDIERWTDKPVVHIPDRVDFKFNKQKKIHTDKRAKSCVWFGYSHNAKVLKPVIPYLKEQNIKLTVITEETILMKDWGFDYFEDNFKCVKYDTNKLNDEIIKHDFVIMPPVYEYRGLYKSNNKTVHSWSLNMPVATNYDEMIELIDPVKRKKIAEECLKEAKEKYDVRESVEQIKELIRNLKNEKKI